MQEELDKLNDSLNKLENLVNRLEFVLKEINYSLGGKDGYRIDSDTSISCSDTN